MSRSWFRIKQPNKLTPSYNQFRHFCSRIHWPSLFAFIGWRLQVVNGMHHNAIRCYGQHDQSRQSGAKKTSICDIKSGQSQIHPFVRSTADRKSSLEMIDNATRRSFGRSSQQTYYSISIIMIMFWVKAKIRFISSRIIQSTSPKPKIDKQTHYIDRLYSQINTITPISKFQASFHIIR